MDRRLNFQHNGNHNPSGMVHYWMFSWPRRFSCYTSTTFRHKVIATARNAAAASKTNPQIASLGGHWMTLDVTSPVSGAVIGEATKIFGWIDILVNNAGYSVLGAVEDIRYSHIPLT